MILHYYFLVFHVFLVFLYKIELIYTIMFTNVQIKHGKKNFLFSGLFKIEFLGLILVINHWRNITEGKKISKITGKEIKEVLYST